MRGIRLIVVNKRRNDEDFCLELGIFWEEDRVEDVWWVLFVRSRIVIMI